MQVSRRYLTTLTMNLYHENLEESLLDAHWPHDFPLWNASLARLSPPTITATTPGNRMAQCGGETGPFSRRFLTRVTPAPKSNSDPHHRGVSDGSSLEL